MEDAAQTERDKLIVRTLADTGIRVGELVALRPSDLQLQGRNQYLKIRGKGSREWLVPLPAALVSAPMSLRRSWPTVRHPLRPTVPCIAPKPAGNVRRADDIGRQPAASGPRRCGRDEETRASSPPPALLRHVGAHARHESANARTDPWALFACNDPERLLAPDAGRLLRCPPEGLR